MKVRLNKKVLAEMPEEVRAIIQAWKEKTGRAFITVTNTDKFYAQEDAKITVLNLLSGDHKSERAAGEFAGLTRLNPCAAIPLPQGCVAIMEEIFLGQHMLTLYQSAPKALPQPAAPEITDEVKALQDQERRAATEFDVAN